MSVLERPPSGCQEEEEEEEEEASRARWRITREDTTRMSRNIPRSNERSKWAVSVRESANSRTSSLRVRARSRPGCRGFRNGGFQVVSCIF